MSSTKLKEARPPLAATIRQLRLALDETQEGMARCIGCTLSGYIQWEKGRRVPGGDWLLKLMALCPDKQTRSLFEERIQSYREHARVSRPQKAPAPSSTTPEQRREARAIAQEAIAILFELGQAGYRPADQKLKLFADELNRVAGDFTRAFPRPK
jgi:transcriptional regulator with XRE-family HTH domain